MRGRLEWRKGSQVTVQSSIRKIILAEIFQGVSISATAHRTLDTDDPSRRTLIVSLTKPGLSVRRPLPPSPRFTPAGFHGCARVMVRKIPLRCEDGSDHIVAEMCKSRSSVCRLEPVEKSCSTDSTGVASERPVKRIKYYAFNPEVTRGRPEARDKSGIHRVISFLERQTRPAGTLHTLKRKDQTRAGCGPQGSGQDLGESTPRQFVA
ncbi:hypothetical protein RRG08_037128 [Elysia crispata]|uniref:Uncharacterized protein n=1 Tax=Elysia crispata TaxID=231223 RepID=A0AAE0Y508_9GAST|nr:hypothetical protein RRG08_037128 [Elysia crispata]